MISLSKRGHLASQPFLLSMSVGRYPIPPAADDLVCTNGTAGRIAPSSLPARARSRLLPRLVWPALIAITLVTGCETELETGYKPRPLNASSTDRRAYYAPPFTPEAVTTPEEDKPAGGDNFHRPGNY
jgi:hypothetical protein